MIGVPDSIPNEPTFVIVIVDPVKSDGPILPSRADAARRVISRDSSKMFRWSAFFTTGTSSPRSVSVAMPMW